MVVPDFQDSGSWSRHYPVPSPSLEKKRPTVSKAYYLSCQKEPESDSAYTSSTLGWASVLFPELWPTVSLLSGLPASTLSTPSSPWHLISSPLRGQSDALSLKNKSQITPLPYSTSCSGPGSWNKALEVLHYWLPLSSQTSSFYYLLLIQLQPCQPPFSSLHPQDCCHPMVLALVFLMLGGIFPDSQVMNSLTASVLCSNVASSEPASWPLCLKL